MAGRGQPLPGSDSPPRVTTSRVQNARNGQNNEDGGAEKTPINEDEGLKALHQLGCDIKRLWDEVEREGGVMVSGPQVARMLELHQTATKHTPKANSIEQRLGAIERQVTTIAKRLPSGTKQLTTSPTWASVAAAPPLSVGSSFRGTLTVPNQNNNAITIRPPHEDKYRGQTPAEVLREVRAAIPGAVAAQPLRSGDMRITMASAQQKETALKNGDSIGQALGAKVLRQDYPVEVQAVPISVPVEHGKASNNTKVIQEMVEGTRRLIPNFTVTRIAWIHGEESIKPKKGETRAPRHASLLVHVPTAELQKKAVQHGIIIEGVIYPTRLYDNALQRTRCFRCNRWGHTQASCHANETCGHCAGQHGTRECPQKDNPSVVRCCNCGKGGHRVWQTSKCPDYKRRLAQLEERRRTMEGISLSWRAERDYQVPLHSHKAPSAMPSSTNEVISGRKRERPRQPEASEDGSRRQGLGRPPKVTPPDPRQPSLESYTRRAAESQCTDVALATQWSQEQHMETEPTQDPSLEW